MNDIPEIRRYDIGDRLYIQAQRILDNPRRVRE